MSPPYKPLFVTRSNLTYWLLSALMFGITLGLIFTPKIEPKRPLDPLTSLESQLCKSPKSIKLRAS